MAGNLGRVDYVNDNEYDLFIRPDTCCPRFRCWFLFTVENVKADQVCLLAAAERIQLTFICESECGHCLPFFSQRVIFHIVNFSKAKSLYRDGMTPLVKSTSRKRW